jgi:hypothetical protein
VQRQGPRGGQIPIRYRAAGGILLVAHLLFVGWVTMRPLHVPWVGPANLHLLSGIAADLALGPREAARQIGGSMLLLAPLGVLLPLAGGRLLVSPVCSLIRTVAAAALLSLGIELLQTGVPGQIVDVDSLLLNPLGVALVHLVLVPGVRARLRRTGGCTQPRRRGGPLTEALEDIWWKKLPERSPGAGAGEPYAPDRGRRDGGESGVPGHTQEGAPRSAARVRIAP